MSKANTIAVYPGDRLTLTRDLETELLIVHLGTPPAVVELAGFELRFDKREIIGFGSFEMWSCGQLIQRIRKPLTNDPMTTSTDVSCTDTDKT
jgi:hypothetical protein